MHLRLTRRPAAASLLLVLALAGLLLAGCGSSSSTTATTSASATAPGGAGSTGASGATGAQRRDRRQGRARQSDPRMPAEGRHQPPRPGHPPERRRGGFLGGSGGGPALPKGVTREQFQAALKKCGLTRRFGAGGRFGAGRANFNTPAFRKTLASFVDLHGRTRRQAPRPQHQRQRPRVRHLRDRHQKRLLPEGRGNVPQQGAPVLPRGRRTGTRAGAAPARREARPPAKADPPRERRRLNGPRSRRTDLKFCPSGLISAAAGAGRARRRRGRAGWGLSYLSPRSAWSSALRIAAAARRSWRRRPAGRRPGRAPCGARRP